MPISPIQRIRDFILAAEGGEMPDPLPEVSEGELGDLEKAVNRLVSRLRLARGGEARREAMEKELRVSRAIQATLLPSTLPEIPGLEVGAFYRPAQEIGGDYYDFIDIDSSHLGIAIADVSGKSISGAMFMTITRNTLRSQAMLTLSPREVLQRTGRLLVPSMMPGFFVSIFYAVLDTVSMKLSCANCGHPPLLLFRSGKKECEWIGPKGIAVGLLRDKGGEPARGPVMEEREIALGKGDLAFFYTDGVSEAIGSDGALFGRERIAEVAREIGSQGARQFLSGLEERLNDFTAGQAPADDITAVVLGRIGEGVSLQ